MKSTLNSKRLLCAILMFIVLVGSVLAINYQIATLFAKDATSINLAGRQRMLSQRITKTLLEMRQENFSGINLVAQQEFRDAVRLFDQTLKGFEQGGLVQGGDGNLLQLRKADTAEAAALVSQAVQAWKPMRETILPRITADEAIPPEVLEAAYAHMQQANLPLLDLMNRLTYSLESSRSNIFVWFQFAVLTLAAAVAAFTVRSLYRSASAAVTEGLYFESLATRDALTKLFNRRELEWALEREFASIQRRGGSMALLLLDLDGFKAVNDTRGHDSGDRVLCTIAERLSECARAIDTVARLGGDEFVLICPGLGGREDAAALCDRLIEAINRPIEIDGGAVQVGASIGIVFSDHCAKESHDLLRCADRAMYAAKQAGRNRYVFASGET